MESSAVSLSSFGHKREQGKHGYCFRPKRNPNQTLSSSSEEGFSNNATSVSNVNRFLQHTTPRFLLQSISKSRLRGLSSEGSKNCEQNYFSLSDLWDSFDEWSAYGAGVPILLNRNETVMQYYVPYLSAIQLYTSAESDFTSKSRRRLGDDSDGSEMDYRDSNSETCSSDGELERVSDPLAWRSLDARGRSAQGETLLFEFFESAAPSQRIPLFDKVRDLVGTFPGLRTLCSNEISQSSWLSVAWYPIYRIPMGRTLKDLTACFLTYHSLSTLFRGDSIPFPEAHTVCGGQMLLRPFGLVGYKFRGPVWNSAGAKDHQQTNALQKLSHEWLKQLRVQHPDFEYFMLHLPSSHH